MTTHTDGQHTSLREHLVNRIERLQALDAEYPEYLYFSEIIENEQALAKLDEAIAEISVMLTYEKIAIFDPMVNKKAVLEILRGKQQ